MVELILTQRNDKVLFSSGDGKSKAVEYDTGMDYVSALRAVGAHVANMVMSRVPQTYNATDINVVFRQGEQ